ncbi:MAG: hypothetical protein ABJ327_04200 [Litoreibacter sp.]
MSKSLLAALGLVVVVSACGTVRESRLNPFNWFGKDRNEAVAVDAAPQTIVDGRTLVDQIVSLDIDRLPGGAIVRTVALPATQGFWDAQLIEVESEDPTALVYQFRVTPPLNRRAQSTQRSREIIAGAEISSARLESIRTITVIGRQNQRTIRR